MRLDEIVKVKQDALPKTPNQMYVADGTGTLVGKTTGAAFLDLISADQQADLRTKLGLGDLATRSSSDFVLSSAFASLVSRVAATETGLAGKANLLHTHVLADIPGLQALLDGKATATDLTALATRVSTTETKITDLQGKIPIIGTYTVATLPAASSYPAKYAYVSDLGGGADMVVSDGTAWKHIRRGKPMTQTIGTTITVTPLVTPTIMLLSGTLNSASMINVATTNIYPGYELTIAVPLNTLGLLGTLGVSLGGSPSLPLLNGTWADYSYNGTTLVKIRGGSL